MRLDRWKWLIATVAWMALIWYLSDQPDLTSGLDNDFVWRKAAHVFVYAVLTWLWARTLSPKWYRVDVLIWASVLTLGYAVIDEWHQSWVPGRTGALSDVIIDAGGIILIWMASVFFRRSA